MGRHRSRSYSPRRRSRTPPPPQNRRKQYDDPRDRRRSDHRRSPPPSGLLVRNIPLDARPEELRAPFEKFGPVKDVYLPRDYYSGEPRGFGFVKFRYPEDAAKAKDRLNYTLIGGREIRIVYAEENRKTPREMRKTGHTSGRYEGRRRTPTRSPRRQYRSPSRSPARKRRDSRTISRSPSPRSERDKSTRSHTPRDDGDNMSKRSLSPKKDSRDERENHRRLRSPSPKDTTLHDGKRYKSSQRSGSPRKMSPHDDDYQPSRSRDISPVDGKGLRSSKRPASQHRESPLRNASPEERRYQKGLRSPSARNSKSYDGKKKSSRSHLSPKEMSPRDLRPSARSVSPPEKSLQSTQEIRTSREISADIDE
ncbi:hypothetical protein KSS87_002085 [Heliosperma pusillum]|nr:hypothetical protein KSS87_002085 [Heliosperma pusillum]